MAGAATLLSFDPALSDAATDALVGASLCMLVTMIASAWLMRALGSATLGAAVGFGLLVGVCNLGSTAVNMAINSLELRPLAYGFLSSSYLIVATHRLPPCDPGRNTTLGCQLQ